MNTVTQCFYSAVICFHKDTEETVTHEEVKFLTDCLNQKFTNGKYNCVSEYEIQDNDVCLTLTRDEKSFNCGYFETECEWTPDYPGCKYDRNGDPGDPPEPATMECYDNTLSMLENIVGNIDGWDYEVYEEEYDTEEMLWEKIDEPYNPY